MAQSVEKERDLLEILVAIAWIDGEIQPEERKFLENIATEHSLQSASELQNLYEKQQDSSAEGCYRLLEKYLGSNPNPQDYESLLSAVSRLIYSDNDIATEEAALLTKIQDLDPQNARSRSAFDRVIAKIQRLYIAGLQKQ